MTWQTTCAALFIASPSLHDLQELLLIHIILKNGLLPVTM